MLYISPVLTVDPLGLGGKSTYALSLGTRINLWETKSPNLSGLKISGWYVGGGYEYYPQQFDMAYLTTWMRVDTFMPLAGKIDLVYAFDDISSGIMYRFCIGLEFKKITFFVCGSQYNTRLNAEHPVFHSPYTTVGSLLLIIPLYTRD